MLLLAGLVDFAGAVYHLEPAAGDEHGNQQDGSGDNQSFIHEIIPFYLTLRSPLRWEGTGLPAKG